MREIIGENDDGIIYSISEEEACLNAKEADRRFKTSGRKKRTKHYPFSDPENPYRIKKSSDIEDIFKILSYASMMVGFFILIPLGFNYLLGG